MAAYSISVRPEGLAAVLGPVAAALSLGMLLWFSRAVDGGSLHLLAYLLGVATGVATATLNGAINTAQECANPPAAIGIGFYSLCQWHAPWSISTAGPPTFLAFGAAWIVVVLVLLITLYRRRRPLH